MLITKYGKRAVQKLRNVASIPSKVDAIFKELRPNGGESVFDKIEAIRTEVRREAQRTRVLWGIQGTGFYECDINGECVYANPALCKLFGLSEEQMRGRGWLSSVADEEERARVWHDWQEAIRNDYPYQASYRIRNAVTGEVGEIKVTSYILRDPSGKPIWFFGIVLK